MALAVRRMKYEEVNGKKNTAVISQRKLGDTGTWFYNGIGGSAALAVEECFNIT